MLTTRPGNDANLPQACNKKADRPLGYSLSTLETIRSYHFTYFVDHIVPKCTLKLYERNQVIQINEDLTTEENEKVPDASNKNTEAFVAITKYNSNEATKNNKTIKETNRGVSQKSRVVNKEDDAQSCISNKPHRITFCVKSHWNKFSPTSVDLCHEGVSPRSEFHIGSANIWFTQTLGRRYDQQNVSFVILDAGGCSSFIRLSEITQALQRKINKVQAAQSSCNASEKDFPIIGTMDLMVQIGRGTELFTFLVADKLRTSAIIGCDFCYGHVEPIKIRMETIDIDIAYRKAALEGKQICATTIKTTSITKRLFAQAQKDETSSSKTGDSDLYRSHNQTTLNITRLKNCAHRCTKPNHLRQTLNQWESRTSFDHTA